MMPSEQIKLSHKFPQNPNLTYLLFFDRLSSKCERRRGINLCHYLRARYDHARTRTHFPALTAYNTQNLWRTMENKFLWSWQISLEYSKAFMPPDMIMQVFCKRYLLSALRFFCGQICTSTLLIKTLPLCSQVSGLWVRTFWNYLSLSFTLLVLCLPNGGKKEKEKSMCYYPVNLPLQKFFEHQCLSRKNVCISITKHTNFFCL